MVPLSLHVTDGEEKPKELPSNCCFWDHNSATHIKSISFCLPNFPSSINNEAGLYPHFPKSLLNPIPQYTLAWIQSQIGVCD